MRSMAERLHKYLASCGVGSRRACEEVILAGRVTVAGEPITELGLSVDAGKDDVRLDGKRVLPEPAAYYVLHKPVGYLSTTRDERGRPTVLDLVPESGRRLFVAGRLDLDSEGLMLITNDGELTNLLTHPRYGVPTTYRLTVAEVDLEGTAPIARGCRTGGWAGDGRGGGADPLCADRLQG